MCGQKKILWVAVVSLFLATFFSGARPLFGEKPASEKGLFYYVVDRSGSIISYGLQEPIRKAITEHAAQLPEDTEVRLVFFSRNASEPQRWESMTAEAKADFAEFFRKNMKPEGPTRLYDTVGEVMNEIRASSEEYRFVTVLVFSDGENNWSRAFRSWKQLEPVYDNLVDRHEQSFVYWITLEFEPSEKPPAWVHHLPQPPGTKEIPVPEPGPEAQFAAHPQQVKAGEEVQFEYEPTGGRVEEFQWDFGDGERSADQNPVHIYEREGSFTVTLRTFGPGGEAAEVKPGYILVSPSVPLTADFRISPERVRMGERVSLQNLSGGNPEGQEWAVNGEPLSREADAGFRVEEEGEISVTLRIWRGEEEEMATRTLEVLPPAPSVEFEISPAEAAFGEAVMLSAKETRDEWRHTWTIDGEVILEGAKVEWVSDRDGLMRVLHTVEGPGGVSRQTDRIFIHPAVEFVPSTAFTIEPRFYKQGETVVFRAAEDHEGWLHEWHLDGEPAGEGIGWEWESDRVGNVAVTHIIRNEATGAVYEESEELLGRPHDLVQVLFSATPTTGTFPLKVQFEDKSSAEGVAFEWDFGDGNVSNLRNPEHVYEEAGDFEVTLAVTNPQGVVTKSAEAFRMHVVPPMPLWQKIVIGAAGALLIWVLLIVPLFLRPILAPQRGPKLVGMRTYSLHLVAKRGAWWRFLWPKRAVTVGSTLQSDVRVSQGTGSRGILALIQRVPGGSRYSIRPTKRHEIYRIEKRTSLTRANAEAKSKITAGRILKDGDVYEIAGERLVWSQPGPRRRRSEQARAGKMQLKKGSFPGEKKRLVNVKSQG